MQETFDLVWTASHLSPAKIVTRLGFVLTAMLGAGCSKVGTPGDAGGPAHDAILAADSNAERSELEPDIASDVPIPIDQLTSGLDGGADTANAGSDSAPALDAPLSR